MSYIVTLVADRNTDELSTATLTRVCDAIGGGEFRWLSYGEAAEIATSVIPAPEIAAVRAALEGAAVDVISTPAHGRRKSLLIADMDSTIVTGETLDELADFAGLKARIAAITARAMNGELDFKAALRERVAMLRGLPAGCAGTHLAARASYARRARTRGDHARPWRLCRAGVRRI